MFSVCYDMLKLVLSYLVKWLFLAFKFNLLTYPSQEKQDGGKGGGMNHRMIRFAVSVTLLLFTLIGIAATLERQNAFAEETRAPENMVLVPGGKFLYGEDKKEITLKVFFKIFISGLILIYIKYL